MLDTGCSGAVSKRHWDKIPRLLIWISLMGIFATWLVPLFPPVSHQILWICSEWCWCSEFCAVWFYIYIFYVFFRPVSVRVSSTQLLRLETWELCQWSVMVMTLLSYFMTLISPLLILLVHVSKFNVHDTPITLPLRLALLSNLCNLL